MMSLNIVNFDQREDQITTFIEKYIHFPDG